MSTIALLFELVIKYTCNVYYSFRTGRIRNSVETSMDDVAAYVPHFRQ